MNKFQKDDLDIKLKCRRCRKRSPLKFWSCKCGTQWHMCVLHSNIGALCVQSPLKMIKVQPQSELESSTTTQKGGQPPATFEKLLAEDKRMELKRKHPGMGEVTHVGQIALGSSWHRDIPSSFLGPILKKRFNRT